MKNCPTCGKNYDDENLKFCQADGAQLVAQSDPPDPFKTVVAGRLDVDVKPAGEKGDAPVEVKVTESSENAGAEQNLDAMKTMMASRPTDANISVSTPVPAPTEPPKSDALSGNASHSPKPEMPPQTKHGEQSPSAVTSAGSSDASGVRDVSGIPPIAPPPAVPAEPKPANNQTSSVPIPSPFDKSMPPGYAPPSTPPFDPKAQVKAEKVGSVSAPAKPNEQVLNQPNRPMPAPPNSSGNSDSKSGGTDNTMAIFSMAAGILSLTLCCGTVGIVIGPIGAVMGQVAKSRAMEHPNQYGGGTMALVGMITGSLGFVLNIAVWLILYFVGIPFVPTN